MMRVSGRLLRQPRFLSCVLQSSAAYSMFVVFISLAPYVMVTSLGPVRDRVRPVLPPDLAGLRAGNWALGRFAGRTSTG